MGASASDKPTQVEGVFATAKAADRAVTKLRPAFPDHDITVSDEPVPLNQVAHGDPTRVRISESRAGEPVVAA